MESLTNEEESESRLYISGLPHKPVKLGKGIRELRHGEVFALAYLDVVFGEDKKQETQWACCTKGFNYQQDSTKHIKI